MKMLCTQVLKDRSSRITKNGYKVITWTDKDPSDSSCGRQAASLSPVTFSSTQTSPPPNSTQAQPCPFRSQSTAPVEIPPAAKFPLSPRTTERGLCPAEPFTS